MLQNLLTLMTRLVLAVVFIGLAVALFFIGIIALWYFLLIGTTIWIVRRIYTAWKTRNDGPIQAGDVEIIVNEASHHPHSKRPRERSGRVIDHE